MSCFEYNYKLNVSVVFFHHHFILYDAIQSPHGLQSTWEVNCFDIIDRIKIIPDYLKKNWKTWTVFCQVVNVFFGMESGFFFSGVDLFEGITLYIIIHVNLRFVWFVFIVDEAKYFYIHRNKRLLSLLKFFHFKFHQQVVAGTLRNGNECNCLRFS